MCVMTGYLTRRYLYMAALSILHCSNDIALDVVLING